MVFVAAQDYGRAPCLCFGAVRSRIGSRGIRRVSLRLPRRDVQAPRGNQPLSRRQLRHRNTGRRIIAVCLRLRAVAEAMACAGAAVWGGTSLIWHGLYKTFAAGPVLSDFHRGLDEVF